jgi:hypothetical protein
MAANHSIFYCGHYCCHYKHSEDFGLVSMFFETSLDLLLSRDPSRGPSAVFVVFCDLVDEILHVTP